MKLFTKLLIKKSFENIFAQSAFEHTVLKNKGTYDRNYIIIIIIS